MRVLQSLKRGLDAIDYLIENPEGVRLTDIALALEVEKSNASHLMRTLMASGYAGQIEGKRYVLGEKLLRLRESVAPTPLEAVSGLREELHPVLETLVSASQECAHMAVLAGDKVWYIDKISSPLPLKVDHPIGSLTPLHCTALGKVFLAFGQAKVQMPLARYTEATITDLTALNAEVELTRQRGYGIDNEEFSAGIRCVAAPVYDKSHCVIAAIGLSGPSARIDDERLTALADFVVKTCGLRNAKT